MAAPEYSKIKLISGSGLRLLLLFVCLVLPSVSQAESGDTQWWSLEPLQRVRMPVLSEEDQAWIKTPIDTFIIAKLREQGLAPSPPADRRTLIRRLSFDLLGLPPTPQEVDRFVSDPDPLSYEKLVDRLLASPHYGERWARHWLDVVHYGDSHGYDKDKLRRNAWPYRDYVIRAFNEDRPYERFVREQLAGDHFYPGTRDGMVALGFIATGPFDYVGHIEVANGTMEKRRVQNIDRDDMVSVTMNTFVSMTAQCARCHNHKFDPISQEDYYSLQAVFAAVDRADRPYDAGSSPQMVYAAATQFSAEGNFKPTEGQPRPIFVLARGDEQNPLQQVGPGTLSCLPGLAARFELDDNHPEVQRRAALADWIVHRRNPLTWRSIVNRIWHYHFGEGVVETPNDFGRMGATPTHPELLDWLAVEFRDGGQSTKELHRLILCSATYRQSSTHNEDYVEIDAGNRLLWRMNRQRLDAESIRDAVLTISGRLRREMGGPGFQPFVFQDDHSPRYLYDEHDPNDPGSHRRSIYRVIVRSVPDPFMTTLDCADPSLLVPRRGETLTALQALALLNNKFMICMADHLATRISRMGHDARSQIRAVYALALQRPPRDEELRPLVPVCEKHGLPNICRLIFNTNEFIFID